MIWRVALRMISAAAVRAPRVVMRQSLEHPAHKPLNVQVKGEAHTTWLQPRLVGEVKFTEWTTSGEMRHPVFLGLRSDKKATAVIREMPA